MDADRTERNNLATLNPEKVAELERLYDAWTNRCGVKPWSVVNEARLPAQKHMDVITSEYREKQR